MKKKTKKKWSHGARLLLIFADGLDASVDGRGWNAKHQAAHDEIIKSVKIRAILLKYLKTGRGSLLKKAILSEEARR